MNLFKLWTVDNNRYFFKQRVMLVAIYAHIILCYFLVYSGCSWLQLHWVKRFMCLELNSQATLALNKQNHSLMADRWSFFYDVFWQEYSILKTLRGFKL